MQRSTPGEKEVRKELKMQEMVEEISEIPANDDGVTSPDQSIVLPAYVPTIEETIKASGAHRSFY